MNSTNSPAVAGPVERPVRPLAECTLEDLVNNHAMVYGRCRIWTHSLTDMGAVEPMWSKPAWWKAMWYSHRGSPHQSFTWGIYGGGSGFTGPGDAELTHFMRMPDAP